MSLRERGGNNMKEEKSELQEAKAVSFRKLIEAIEKEGLRVCDIHIEEEHDPNLRQYNKFTGSVVIKIFPEHRLLLTG
jgi:hypothetical protein